VNSVVLRHSDQIFKTKSVPQEQQRLQVPRMFRERTVQNLKEHVQGCVVELVFNRDEVGISDWEDRKTKTKTVSYRRRCDDLFDRLCSVEANPVATQTCWSERTGSSGEFALFPDIFSAPDMRLMQKIGLVRKCGLETSLEFPFTSSKPSSANLNQNVRIWIQMRHIEANDSRNGRYFRKGMSNCCIGPHHGSESTGGWFPSNQSCDTEKSPSFQGCSKNSPPFVLQPGAVTPTRVSSPPWSETAAPQIQGGPKVRGFGYQEIRSEI
jgi:hypothetical protein